MIPTIEIFLCYAHEDEELRKGLEKQLRALKRQGLINTWHDRNISAGAEWEREIDKHLNTARIILLLVSPDFMDSDNCNAYIGKGDALYNLNRNQEALVAYQHAIQLDPNNADAFGRKAFVLKQMQKPRKHILNLEVGYRTVPSIKLKQELNGDSI